MKRFRSSFLKYTLIFVLLLVPIFLLSLYIAVQKLITTDFINNDVNQYLQKNYDISLQVTDVKTSLYPNLKIKIQGFHLNNTTHNQVNTLQEKDTLLKADHSEIEIGLLSLFKKELQIKTIALHDAHAYYKANKNGQTNWDNLLKDNTDSKISDTNKTNESLKHNKIEETDQTQKNHAASSILDQLKITNHHISFTNVQASIQTPEINQQIILESFGISEFSKNDPFNLSFKLSNKPNTTNQVKQKESNNLSDNLSSVIDGQINMSFDLESKTIDIITSIINVKLQQHGYAPIHFALSTKTSIDLNASSLTAPVVNLLHNSNPINGSLTVNDFNAPIITANINAQNYPITIFINNLNNAGFIELPPNVILPEVLSFNTKLNINTVNQTIATSEENSIEFDDATLKFSLSLDYTKQLLINSVLSLDGLNPYKYIAVIDAEKDTSTPEENSNTTKQTTQETIDTPLPLNELANLRANVDVTITNTKLKHYTLKKINLKIQEKASTLKQSSHIFTVHSDSFFDGKIDSKTNLTASAKRLNINGKLDTDHVNLGTTLQTLFKETSPLELKINSNINFSTHGDTTNLLSKNFKTNGGFKSSNAILEGTNLTNIIYNNSSKLPTLVSDYLFKNDYKHKPGLLTNTTEIGNLQGIFEFKNNIAQLKPVTFDLRKAKAKTQAVIDLNTQTLTHFHELEIPENVDKNLSKLVWPIHCEQRLSGTTEETKPTCRLEINKLENQAKIQLKNKAKALEKRAKEKLKSKIAPKLEKEKNELKEKAQALEDKYKDKLKSLFN